MKQGVKNYQTVFPNCRANITKLTEELGAKFAF